MTRGDETASTGPATVGPLHLVDDELVACVSCGLCLPHCPTYRVTGLEIASPRGRIAAMRAVEAGDITLDDPAFLRAVHECIQCRGCEAACPSSVPFGHLMEDTRAAIGTSSPGPARRVLEWIGYRLVLPRRTVLRLLSWVLWAVQRISPIPTRLGVPRLEASVLRSKLTADPAATADAWLFTGCVMDAWQRDTHANALAVMRATGAEVALAGRGADCCGALHVHAGRRQEARRLAERVMGAFPGDAPIVVDSAGCGAALADYGRLLATPDARAFSARVMDFAEWVSSRGAPRFKPSETEVVIQDPCHLRHVRASHEPVHDLLALAYRTVATPDDGLCCGAGGAYSLSEPELAAAVRDAKVAALRAAGGRDDPLVASSNPGCIFHLRAGGVDARHAADLLAAALADQPSEHIDA